MGWRPHGTGRLRKLSLRALTALAALALLAGARSGCRTGQPGLSTEEWRALDDGVEAVRIDGLALDPEDPDRLVVVAASGVFLSDDGGGSWRPATEGLPAEPSVGWSHLVANALWPDPRQPARLYAQLGGRIYRSDDFGASWTDASGVCPACTGSWQFGSRSCIDTVAGVVPHPTIDGALFAATVASGAEGGVLFSPDGGATWQWRASSAGNATPCPAAERAASGGVRPRRIATLESDGARRPSGPPATAAARPSARGECPCVPKQGMENDAWPLAIDPARPEVLFAGGPHPATDCGNNGLKRSLDGGITWHRIVDKEICRQGTGAILADPDSERGWLVSGRSTYRSKDDGETWARVETLPWVRQFVVDGKGAVWAVGDSVWRRGKGSLVWEPVELPVGVAPKSLAVGFRDGVPILYLGGRTAGLFRREGTAPWQRVSDGLPTRLAVADLRAEGARSLVLAVSQLGLFERRDRRPWRPLGPRLTARYSDHWSAVDLSEIYWAGDDRILRWRDGEAAWTELEIDFGALEGQAWVSRLRRHPRLADRVYAVVQDTESRTYSFLRLRVDGDRLELLGATPLEGKNPYRGHVFPDLVVDPEDDERLLLSSYQLAIAGTASGLQVSTDDGRTFERLEVARLAGDDRSIHQLTAADPAAGRYRFLTWGARLFVTDDAFATVREVPTALTWQGTPWSRWIWSVAANPAGRRVVAYDWHDDVLYPEDRPGRVRWADGLPTNGEEWLELSDAGLPRESIGLDRRAVAFLPWDDEAVLLATGEHGLWARRLPAGSER